MKAQSCQCHCHGPIHSNMPSRVRALVPHWRVCAYDTHVHIAQAILGKSLWKTYRKTFHSEWMITVRIYQWQRQKCAHLRLCGPSVKQCEPGEGSPVMFNQRHDGRLFSKPRLAGHLHLRKKQHETSYMDHRRVCSHAMVSFGFTKIEYIFWKALRCFHMKNWIQ